MKPSSVDSNLFVLETSYCLRGTNKFEPTEFLILPRLKYIGIQVLNPSLATQLGHKKALPCWGGLGGETIRIRCLL